VTGIEFDLSIWHDYFAEEKNHLKVTGTT